MARNNTEPLAADTVEHPYYNTVKVHRLLCLELKKLVDGILLLLADIESARPRASGMQALCSLQSAIDKAKQLLQHCSESSKLYLAITARFVLLRCEKIRKTLEICMNQVQDNVPLLLATKIYEITDQVRRARFILEPSEYEAGAVLLAMLEQISASGSKIQSEIEALRLAALRLNITSPFALLIEQRSIKKLLGKVHDRNSTKRKILNYLLYLLKKHGKLISQFQSNIPVEEEDGLSMDQEKGVKEEETPANDFFIPEQFKCPISLRLLYDPVIIASGKTFERVWIEKWFSEGHQVCPVTNTRLEQLLFTPNLAMKNLISEWCLRHGISIPEHAQPVPTLLSLLESSSISIASSFGGSVFGLQLRLENVSLNSLSTDSSVDSSDEKCIDENKSERPQVAAVSHSQIGGHTSSSHEINAAFLSELDKHSWKSKCKAVENVKGLLEDNDKAQYLTFSNSHIKPVITFLKEANEIRDRKMQKDGTEVLLAVLNSSRVELPPCHEDVVYLLASLLDSEPAGESLAIMEVLSWQQYYKSRIVASGVLPSILKVLDNNVPEFHMLAIKILRNLSNGTSDVGYHTAYLGYIPKLVSFLEDSNVAGYCIEIIKNICNIEEARIEVAGANLCTSIAKLLEGGNTVDQELAVDVLLCLCYEDTWYCQRVMTESIIQPLVSISVNGSPKGKENAKLLLDLLGCMMKIDASYQYSTPSTISSRENSHVSSSNFSVKISSSKAFGFLKKKVLRFFNAK